MARLNSIPKDTLIRMETKCGWPYNGCERTLQRLRQLQRVATALQTSTPYDRLRDERRNWLEGLALTRFSAPISIKPCYNTPLIMLQEEAWELRSRRYTPYGFEFKRKKSAPTWRWFQKWLKKPPELHTIKTKPIARHRVDMHSENDLRRERIPAGARIHR
jgi:hypothetical protein